MWIIKKNNNLYVAKGGRNYSYTNKLSLAEKFKTKEEAFRNKCDNEYVVNIYNEIGV